MKEPDSIVVHDLELFPHERTLLVKGRPVDVTAREFDILQRLATHPGWVYSAEQLSDGEDEAIDTSPDSVRVHIAHLRHKLAEAGVAEAIGTVRGVGYRLEGQGPRAQDAAACDATGRAGAEPESRRLRDAFWLLERAVLEAEATGDPSLMAAAREALDEARRTISRWPPDE